VMRSSTWRGASLGRSVLISARASSARAGTSSRGIGCAAGASSSDDPAAGVCARAIDPEIQTPEIATRSADRPARRLGRTDDGEYVAGDYTHAWDSVADRSFKPRFPRHRYWVF
jgi:hypothetical protein